MNGFRFSDPRRGGRPVPFVTERAAEHIDEWCALEKDLVTLPACQANG